MNNETKTIEFLIADLQCLYTKMGILREQCYLSCIGTEEGDANIYWRGQLLDLQFMINDAIRRARYSTGTKEE